MATLLPKKMSRKYSSSLLGHYKVGQSRLVFNRVIKTYYFVIQAYI